jgi:hypothetical protein
MMLQEVELKQGSSEVLGTDSGVSNANLAGKGKSIDHVAFVSLSSRRPMATTTL